MFPCYCLNSYPCLLSCCVHRSAFYVCPSIPALQIDSWVAFFLDSIYTHTHISLCCTLDTSTILWASIKKRFHPLEICFQIFISSWQSRGNLNSWFVYRGEFLSLGTIDVLVGSLLVVRLALYIAGHLAASLASLHQMPAGSVPSTSHGNQKHLQTLPNIS